MRKTLLVAGTAAVLAVGLATPAMADDTTATFNVTGGTLTVAGQPSATLTDAAIANAAEGALGVVTVTDARNNANSAWTATAQSGSFTTGVGDANRSIPNTAATYTTGVVTEGLGAADNAAITSAAGVFGVDARTAASNTGFGDNAATWNPMLSIMVPAGTLSGIYSGVVTTSVS
jgi:hypothetical protein